MKVRSIAAGAGTGKTTELTRIIRDRVTSGECRPHAIIGTTFTNKAAAELVERVRQELFKTGKLDLAERLSESLLGTVDSVCLRLLTRFAFEAGISPAIQIIAETEATQLLSGAIEDSCSLVEMQTIQRLGERLWQKDGFDLNWKTQIGLIADKARENAIFPHQLNAMAKQSCDGLLYFFPAPAPGGAALDAALAQAIGNAIQNISASKDKTKGTEGYVRFLRECERDLAEERLTWSQWVKLSKEQPAKASRTEAQPVLSAAARYDSHPRLRADIEQYVILLFEFAAQALTRYQERKEERGLLDFVDLEQRTLEILQQAQVANVISQEFDLLLVDEFQDTNPIQLALFIRLAALVKHGAVWVGDAKQAIYGFRGSDPALMDAVLENLTAEKGQTLKTTYRARPELTQIFNDLFVPAFEKALRLQKGEIELCPDRAHDPLLPAAIEFWDLCSGQLKKDGEPKQPTNEQSAQALAEGVVQLLSAPCRIEDRASRQLRPLQLRDIAILCRTNQGATTVAEALQARGFPVTLGTSGLLSTPEACLALACLRRLTDKADTLATAEIIALEAEHGPKEWLENRLNYLAAHSEEWRGVNWGLEPPMLNDSLIALSKAQKNLDQLTPSEALDVALGAGNVFSVVSRWGPSEARSEQRRANLEALRGFARQYERSCAVTHRPASIAGFVFWCRDLDLKRLDLKAADERANGIHVMTYHGAKGLEWPVVICADLDSEHRTNLWEITVIQGGAFDALDPLANRRIRFWPWPFGQQKKDIPAVNRIANDKVSQEASAAAAREELRLLYVGFTRARDLLVLVTEKNQRSAWLELLEAPWFRPIENAGAMTEGLLGPARVPYRTRTIQPNTAVTRTEPATAYRWFPAPVTPKPKPSASIVPSQQPAIASARITQTINLGKRLPISDNVDENVLGDALHAMFAAEFTNPGHPDRLFAIERILRRYGLDQNIKAQDAVDMVDRFAAHVTEVFRPTSILVETPFVSVNGASQRTAGFIDLLLETSRGIVMIDHKSFLGRSADWTSKALSYSGQLAAYRSAIADRSVESVWIHFAAGGGLAQIEWSELECPITDGGC
jgi:ATP-dependent exoDNAse (exonuclease V) beta subunit